MMTMKKILLLLLLITAATPISFEADSQNAVGDWMIHTSYVGSAVKAVAETPERVYYLSGGNLFALDKETEENEALNRLNSLSDMGIKAIYYNSDEDYLVVVYSNSNLDVIRKNGSVVNLPEIKDAVLTTSKAVNDVTFAPGLMYVATDFGYVVIDDSKMVVKESHLFGTRMSSVAQVGTTLIASTADAMYWGETGKHYEHLSAMHRVNMDKSNCRLWPIDGSRFICESGWTSVITITVNHDVEMESGESGDRSFAARYIIEAPVTVAQHAPGGWLLNVPYEGKCYKADMDVDNLQVVSDNGEICSQHPNGSDILWAAGDKGLHQQHSGNYYLPNALTYATPYWMTYNTTQDLLYVASTAANGIVSTASPTAVNTYDGVTWTDVTPDGAPIDGSFWLEFVPGEPNTYLLGTWREGLLKVVDGEIAMAYNTENSPMAKKWSMHPITSIDRNGNLWVVQSYENPEHPVMVLPAAKVKQSQVTASDWITPEIEGTNTGHTMRGLLLSTRNSNYDIKLFTDGDFKMPLVMWNSNGEISSRPPRVSFDKFNDQDGMAFSWTNITCLTEDLNGMVWMGNSEGVCYFNPAQAFAGGSDFTVMRPKVPRNDGTGMADRLMDGIQVNSVAVDGANRKWIATQSSGLFLVSPNGDEIIKKFNTTNSPLASNTVYTVCCNPNSNSVYVTTPAGLYEYFSDSSPAEPTYDNVFAYPNPVRPEYGGSVTIKGLMDNSLVKITDASGNVLAQLKSTGGMVTWDCCDQYGNAVKSGVYLVLCSQASGSGKAAVTKIAVIR